LDSKPQTDFNREHVIPEALGKSKNNLVLHKTVCRNCNKYFGDCLEVILNRDTAEGVYRYKFGIKPKNAPKHRRVNFQIAEGEELAGMHVRPISESRDDISLEPVAQVGFLNKETGRYVYFKVNEIPEKNSLIEMGLDISEFQMLSPKAEDLPILLETLEKKGLRTEVKGYLEWPDSVKRSSQVAILGDLRIDSPIFRAICKIGFNYLAAVLGREFVLRDDFNGIRNYIRYDNGDTRHYFSTDPRPILYEENRSGVPITEGHIIIAEWQGIRLVAKIRVFNLFTYVVTFCPYYSGIWFPFASGHHFDVHEKTISKLGKASKRLMPN
jgi:hypothetical protein